MGMCPIKTNFQAPIKQAYTVLDGYQGPYSTLRVVNTAPIDVEIISPPFRLRLATGVASRFQSHLEQCCGAAPRLVGLLGLFQVERFMGMCPIKTNFQAPIKQAYTVLDGYQGPYSTLRVGNPIDVEIISPLLRPRLATGVDSRFQSHLQQCCGAVATLRLIGLL